MGRERGDSQRQVTNPRLWASNGPWGLDLQPSRPHTSQSSEATRTLGWTPAPERVDRCRRERKNRVWGEEDGREEKRRKKGRREGGHVEGRAGLSPISVSSCPGSHSPSSTAGV